MGLAGETQQLVKSLLQWNQNKSSRWIEWHVGDSVA